MQTPLDSNLLLEKLGEEEWGRKGVYVNKVLSYVLTQFIVSPNDVFLGFCIFSKG